MNEKLLKQLNIEQFINLIIIRKRIKTTYFENEIFQRFMNVKRTNKRKIFFTFYKKISNWNWITAKFKTICFESKTVYMFQQTKFCKSTSSNLHMNQNQSIMQNNRRHMTKSIVIIIDSKCMFQWNNTSKHDMHAKELNIIAMRNKNCSIFYRYRKIIFKTYRSILLRFYQYANVIN